jgi:hypothetical protein
MLLKKTYTIAMWKSIFVKVIRVVVLSLLLAQFTFSSALAEESQLSSKESSEEPELVNRPLPKLPNLPAPETPNSPAPEIPGSPRSARDLARRFLERNPQASQKYDIQAVKRFNDELYGEQGN